MVPANFQALIVDDDPIARRTVGFALGREQFQCSYAVDGEDAGQRLAEQRFDVVVTDLRMPKKHGHALAVELLQSGTPPLIIVHSSIDDPRLTKDLLLRGVDDIVYKPTNYKAFAAKVKSLVVRRRSLIQSTSNTSVPGRHGSMGPRGKSDTHSEPNLLPAVSIEEYENRIIKANSRFPLVPDVHRIFQLANNQTTTTDTFIDLLRHFPQFSAEAAKLIVFARQQNGSQSHQDEVREVVTRIGYNRIGQLALAFNAITVAKSSEVTWIDSKLCLERVIAATLALRILSDKCSRIASKESLITSALVYPLGRQIMGHVFPEEYAQILSFNHQRSESLVELEAKVFPESQTRCLARLLKQRDFPAETCNFVSHLLDDFGTIYHLPEPLRSQLELLKLAIFIGELAVGRWHEWDLIEPPPYRVLRRWRMISLGRVVDSVREGLQQWLHANPQITRSMGRKQPGINTVIKPMANESIEYLPHSGNRSDWMESLATCLGIRLIRTSPESTSPFHGLIVDFLDSDPAETNRMAQRVEFSRRKSLWMISKEREAELETNESCLVFPCSIRAFCESIERITN